MQKPHVHRAASQLSHHLFKSTSELERFAPQWTEQTHSDWPVLHKLMRPAHLRGYEGVKNQEISWGTYREKIETDVQGDSYSKISWDLFARILFWLGGGSWRVIFYTATVAAWLMMLFMLIVCVIWRGNSEGAQGGAMRTTGLDRQMSQCVMVGWEQKQSSVRYQKGFYFK